jgi:hypothetical protein
MTLQPLDLREVSIYIEANIDRFHLNRLKKLIRLELDEVLLRKNPYLFKSKNILTAESLVKSILDAYLSSQEETLFGDFLESIAVFVCEKVFGGRKPSIPKLEGIDLIFTRSNILFFVEIKSGPNWGNASQLKKMRQNFEQARVLLTPLFPESRIVAVNGCMYGRETSVYKANGDYYKICGQDFWEFISASPHLYIDIIEPLGFSARQRNQDFELAYAQLVNRFAREVLTDFSDLSGQIDWQKLIEHVSARRAAQSLPFTEDFL